MTKALHNKKGLTLVEVMIAILILSLTGFAFHYMFQTGDILLAEQEHRRAVYEMAQKRMSAYKFVSDYHNPGQGRTILVPGTTEGSEIIDLGLDGDEETSIYANYTVTVTPNSSGDYATIDVLYEWEERSGADDNVRLVDIFPYEAP